MSKNIYVGNLPFQTTSDELIEAFSKFGTVTRAQVVTDRETGRSRGFGFVEMSEGGDEAINNMNGAQFQGRTLTVNEAKPREERPRTGGYGGGGGGGGGRGGYGDRPRNGGGERRGGGGGGYGNRW
ncbi:MAG: RNA-binding protein [Gemmataceae bacterium]